MPTSLHRFESLVALAVALCASTAPSTQDRRPLGWQDVRSFRALHDPTLSADGSTIAWEERAETGDGQLTIKRLAEEPLERRVARGRTPQLSADGRYALARLAPPEDHKQTPTGVVFVDVVGGQVETAHDATDYAVCDAGAAAVWLHRPVTPPDTAGAKPRGGRLVIRPLGDGPRTALFDVTRFATARDGAWIAWCTARGKHGEELFVRRLEAGRPTGEAISLGGGTGHSVGSLTWRDDGTLCAAVLTPLSSEGKPEGDAVVVAWSPERGPATVVDADSLPDDLVVAAAGSTLRLGEHTARVFVPVRSRADELRARNDEDDDGDGDGDGTDGQEPAAELAKLRAEAEVDVWHGGDLRIAPQRRLEEQSLKQRTRTAVHHLDSGRTLLLGDAAHPEVSIHEPDADRLLAENADRHRRARTWDVGRQDLALVDVRTGAVEPILAAQEGTASLSPDGATLAFWRDGHWHLRDCATGGTRNLTADLGRSFAQQHWDYAHDAPPESFGGFVAGGQSLLLHDHHDLWEVPSAGGPAVNLTRGRGARDRVVFRVMETDPEDPWVPADGPLLLAGFDERTKHTGLFRLDRDSGTLTHELDGAYRYRRIATARSSGALLISRESYDCFPDLHLLPGGVAGPSFRDSIQQLSHLDDQRAPFAWGTARVLNYRSDSGQPLDAAVIVPDGWTPEQGRLPVLVYYYRFFSQRACEWNEIAVNHRPCFPVYASDGYAVFLPDIRFEVGRPGPAAVACLDAGIDALIEAGIADPDRIALHGHSWSGYQTAFAVTQTDRYACAIAGAPVSNMTSAYGGIRWGSGLARQFQYERTQSRLGASLFERRDRYIENSPLFFADRVNTPLLILFGDEDGAVPWEQGIELYLALRRLDKDVLMLTYRGEPHHPQKAANKLDWAMRMKEYIDHHLKGAPAPAWVSTPQDLPR